MKMSELDDGKHMAGFFFLDVRSSSVPLDVHAVHVCKGVYIFKTLSINLYWDVVKC